MVNKHLVIDMLLAVHKVNPVNFGIPVRAVKPDPDIVPQQSAI